jgi:hypothetical protein
LSEGEVIEMAEKIANTGISREEGYLYFLDKDGDVSRVKMARGRKGRGSPEKVKNAGVKRETGYLYFIDKDGDVCKSKMMRGRKKKGK